MYEHEMCAQDSNAHNNFVKIFWTNASKHVWEHILNKEWMLLSTLKYCNRGIAFKASGIIYKAYLL